MENEIISRNNVTFYFTYKDFNFFSLCADYAVRQKNGNWIAYKVVNGIPAVMATIYSCNHDFDILFDDEVGMTVEAKVKEVKEM